MAARARNAMKGTRSAQKIRLWLYLLIIIAGMIYSVYRGGTSLPLFIIVGLAMFSPFLEFCPECKRLI